MKIISMSLWGNDPKYCVGAIENAKLVNNFFSGWKLWLYCGNSVPENVIQTLLELHCNVIKMPESGNWTSMFWRFMPASDPDVEVMISRDCDSRLSIREKKAVDEWLKSNKSFHIIRDHPKHEIEILGGMWGVKYPKLANMDKLIKEYVRGDFWQVDQNFLKEVIYPFIKEDCFVHDEFFKFETKRHNFPVKRKKYEFVGESFDENNISNSKSRNQIKMYLRKNNRSILKKIIYRIEDVLSGVKTK